MTLIGKYIGGDTGSYGFCCEDGHIYTYSMKLQDNPLVDTKCNQGDEILIRFDLRKDKDNISYERNNKFIGKDKGYVNGILFRNVTNGGKKEINFGLSAEYESELEILEFKIDEK